jgi:hypothetical protein
VSGLGEGSKDEADVSRITRIAFMQIGGFVARTKYYSVWCIA